MFFLTRSFVFGIPILLLLTACGGDGGGDGDGDGDGGDAATTEISLGASAVDITTISAGPISEVAVDGQTTVTVDTVPETAILAAYSAEDDLVFLSVAESGDESVALNSLSTVEAILRLVPGIALVIDANPGLYDTLFTDVESIDALAQFIADNPDWASGGLEFEDLLRVSMIDALAIINTYVATAPQARNVSVLSTDTGRSSLSQAASPERLTAQKVYIDAVEPTYTFEFSGATLSRTSQETDKTEFSLTNSFRRWAVAIVGENPKDNSSDLVIDGTTSLLLAGKDKSATISVNHSDVPYERSTDYGVFLYGPAISDFGNRPTSGQAEAAFWLATAYTGIFEVSIPTISKVTGLNECMKGIFSPSSLGGNLAKQLAASTGPQSIRTSVAQKDWSKVGVQIGDILITQTANAGTACITDAASKLLVKLIPVVGTIKVIYDGIETIVDLGDLTVELGVAKSESLFNLTNAHDQDFYMLGEGYVAAPTFGELHYTGSADLQQLGGWEAYTGDCLTNKQEAEAGTYTCEAYTYNSDAPYRVNFTLRCFDRVDTNTEIGCKSALLTFPNSEMAVVPKVADGDGVVRITVDFDSIGEYVGQVATVDVQGGLATPHDFQVQIKRAQPQLKVLYGGSPVPYVIDEDGDMVITPPVEVACCEDGENSTTIDFELRNEGWGDAKVNIGPTAAGGNNPDFATGALSSLSIPGRAGGNGAAESVTWPVTYNPDISSRTDGGIFLLIGSLGGRTPSVQVAQDEYSKIVLNLRPELGPETVFGGYTVCIVGNSCYPLTISEGTPGDGIAYVTYARHQNWQGAPVMLGDQATFLSASGGPTVFTQRITCDDGVPQDINVVWTSELSIDLTGGSNGTQTEITEYGECRPSNSSPTPVFVQIP